MTRDEHNRAEWLIVRWLGGVPGRHHHAGWYVGRCCPCHWGARVTLPFPGKARAERVRRVILGELTTPSKPRLQWKREVAT
jgi:hypothetical protein